jgi:hypothetical protein
MAGAENSAQAFDLNIEKVLEHWTIPFAIRELIANALDEQMLTVTPEPVIFKDGQGDWHIADQGRGLRYEHLTQNENAEKRRHPQVIGQFGMGLKDALAVFDRRGVRVRIFSKAFFLRYSSERLLESTEYGDVLARESQRRPARVYVKGLFVAEEPNFLFSYNVTKLSAPLRRALNRERSNVGRGAYSDRVKAILTACRSSEVAGPLAEDLKAFASGRLHDELAWRDVALHACRVLQSNEKVVFVTPWQMAGDTAQVQYAMGDGYRIVVVPEDIARSLGGLTDLHGRPLIDLNGYRSEWNASFTFVFVPPVAMTAAEQAVFGRTGQLASLVGTDLSRMRVDVLISETMRLNETGNPVLGVWEAGERRIVVRRDQLAGLARYAGTLLHEIGHMTSGTPDGSLDFESELSRLLGVTAAAALVGAA